MSSLPAPEPDRVPDARRPPDSDAPTAESPGPRTLTSDDGTDGGLEAHHLGDEPAVTGDHRHSTVHRLGRVSMTGGFDLPGEFDLPPEEPVVLVGEVPWELRDVDDAERS